MTHSRARQAAEALRAAHDNRMLHARQWADQGRPVVGCIGADAPVELITAAGALPVRLAGTPGRDTRPAGTYLAGAVDPQAVNVLMTFLPPGGPDVDLVVITHDCDASVQLFYTLRELRRIGATTLPPVCFVDLLHLPGDATLRYNVRRLRRLADQLAAWRGHPLDATELEQAVTAHNAARAARSALRRHRASALPGAEALRWYTAGTVMPPDVYARTVTEALESPAAPPAGRRLFLSGSTHDTADVYDALEADGWFIVGDDHDGGDAGDQPPVTEPTLEGLAAHYTRAVLPAAARTPEERAATVGEGVRRTGAEAFLSYCRRYDDAHLWDFAAQRAAVSVPSALVRDQPYGAIDLDALGTPSHPSGSWNAQVTS
ncbi:2-hydroxyacyl-CoA dehydratase family protein [Streptomyces sp. S465]|uniref:2-hydroxyacyl-CoA dehydratase family protein n=1 Tax=Streptomyces sp. S465 TaxID=2979468 RepID=UPI0022A8C94C|nr:2-hydroxyacyl-CoA dehydratase family protein [Streptomyces sp. S465]WAP53563.1 2-hydroxyacyl-CoA dehydratase family protein [Streptomyces sp. S465]